MKYRQWKKNYKKLHGVNPPLELDKRKQRRLAKKAIKHISRVDFAAVATRVAEKIAEILESDHLEHTRQTSPDRIQRRSDAADSLRAAVITAYESWGVSK